MVSGCHALLCFKPADDACSLGCEWLPCLAVFKLADDACPLLSSWCVVAMPCCALSLLMMPVLCSLGCEWLPYLAVLQAC